MYSAPLFEHDLIRTQGLIPTEYLFFYYSRTRALANQRRQGSTRGEQIALMNESLAQRLLKLLERNDDAGALQAYIDYLNLRSGSYMKLEGEAVSAFDTAASEEDPFRAATGYHRIALDIMNALVSDREHRVIVNTRNGSANPDLASDDIIEATSRIGSGAIQPEPTGALPEAVKGLVLATKAYERASIEAAVTNSERTLRKAMLLYPAIGEWEPSARLLQTLRWR